jgi:GrpB-like predicted nucleotidyltransferase (UPF0157 family)
LRIREPQWHEHRLFSPLERDANVLVVSRGCSEIERCVSFRDLLRDEAKGRELYARTQRDLARRAWRDTDAYAQARGEVIERTIARGLPTEFAEE